MQSMEDVNDQATFRRDGISRQGLPELTEEIHTVLPG